jgi:K+:H+ antiporter subunit KhtT
VSVDGSDQRLQVEEVRLPGIGVRFDLVTHRGRRVGVISHRSGRRELVVGDLDDPDACSATVTLTSEEADALAALLGAPRVIERLAALREQLVGLVSEQVTLPPVSPFVGRTLGDTAARTRTGASVIAVLRGNELIPSPDPGFRFQAGDGVVVVGTAEGVERVTQILTG